MNGATTWSEQNVNSQGNAHEDAFATGCGHALLWIVRVSAFGHESDVSELQLRV
jgi:hypothetical protein